jgi:hypothetical protein
MSRFMIDEDDLNLAARSYGLENFRKFRLIVIEGGGKITGVI